MIRKLRSLRSRCRLAEHIARLKAFIDEANEHYQSGCRRLREAQSLLLEAQRLQRNRRRAKAKRARQEASRT
jgi:hypothetical protein